MNQQDYQIRVLETEAKPDTLAMSTAGLDIILTIGVAAGEVMNRAKRAMFYGKPLELAELVSATNELAETARCLSWLAMSGHLQNEESTAKLRQNGPLAQFPEANIANVNKRLLHGAIGGMSEVAEKLEALRNQLLTGNFDLVNYAEEMGDGKWYEGIELDELDVLARAEAETNNTAEVFDVSPDAIRARNIKKLEKRNKGRVFNADATVNRDTAAEREILEAAAPIEQAA